MPEEGKHADLTYRIIGCAQRVHGELVPGFPESVYHRALCQKLLSQRIPFVVEKGVEVYYQGVCCGEFRLDLFVEDSIVVELKALSDLTDDHLAQTLAYLKATGKEVGLLLNFGCKSLQVKRVIRNSS